MNKPNTVGKLIELLSKYPKDTMICVEDMDGNAFYTEDIAEHLDCDNPTVELILPIYIKDISIEPECESSVFVNQDVKIWE